MFDSQTVLSPMLAASAPRNHLAIRDGASMWKSLSPSPRLIRNFTQQSLIKLALIFLRQKTLSTLLCLIDVSLTDSDASIFEINSQRFCHKNELSANQSFYHFSAVEWGGRARCLMILCFPSCFKVMHDGFVRETERQGWKLVSSAPREDYAETFHIAASFGAYFAPFFSILAQLVWADNKSDPWFTREGSLADPVFLLFHHEIWMKQTYICVYICGPCVGS